MALMMPSPNSSRMSSVIARPYTWTISSNRYTAGSLGSTMSAPRSGGSCRAWTTTSSRLRNSPTAEAISALIRCWPSRAAVVQTLERPSSVAMASHVRFLLRFASRTALAASALPTGVVGTNDMLASTSTEGVEHTAAISDSVAEAGTYALPRAPAWPEKAGRSTTWRPASFRTGVRRPRFLPHPSRWGARPNRWANLSPSDTGCPKHAVLRAEMTPVEPDPGRAGVGMSDSGRQMAVFCLGHLRHQAGRYPMSSVDAALAIDRQIVLVTGGARGLGSHLVRSFLREGANVVI